MDYGFPSGEELLQDIVNILKGNLLCGNIKLIKNFIAYIAFCYIQNKKIVTSRYDQIIENYLEIIRKAVEEFELRLIRSNAASIDDFLDKNSEGFEELAIIGKILIVMVISVYEKRERLFYTIDKVGEGHRYQGRLPYPIDHCLSLTRGWYNSLWTKIYDDIGNNLSKLTIISFNYDRSFEYYLLNSVQSMSSGNASEIINGNLLIHHVYGQLGRLSWQPKALGVDNEYEPIRVENLFSAILDLSMRQQLQINDDKSICECFNKLLSNKDNPYININKICNIVEMIRTYHEASKDVLYEHIKKRLKEAETMFFLGFGYHPQNMKWLQHKEVNANNKLIYAGTVYGKGKEDVGEIRVGLSKLFSSGSTYISQSTHFKPEYSGFKIKEYLANVVNVQ